MEMAIEDIVTNPNICDKHNSRAFEYYCLECSEPLCSKCLVEYQDVHLPKSAHKIIEL